MKIVVSITELSLNKEYYSIELIQVDFSNNEQLCIDLYCLIRKKIERSIGKYLSYSFGYDKFNGTGFTYLCSINKDAMYKITSYLTNLTNELDKDISLAIEASKLRTIYTIID